MSIVSTGSLSLFLFKCARVYGHSDLATTAPGWPTTSIGPDGSAVRLNSAPISCQQDSSVVESVLSIQTEVGQAVFAISMSMLIETESLPSLVCLPSLIRKEDEEVCREGLLCPCCCRGGVE